MADHDWRAINRLSWNYANYWRSRILDRGVDPSAARIPGEVLRLLPKLEGKRILHLFCSDGSELMDLTQSNASGVGVDFSESAISSARRRARAANSPCQFECAEVMDWLSRNTIEFDFVFTSLGSLWWMEDLYSYFAALFRFASKGASYLAWDFHPLLRCLDANLSLSSDYPFDSGFMDIESGIEDYFADDQDYRAHGYTRRSVEDQYLNPYPVREYRHSISTLLSSASAAGWRVSCFIEWPWIAWERYYPSLVDVGDGYFSWPEGRTRLPLTYALRLEVP
jgi:SAM-dependent methyltransferase